MPREDNAIGMLEKEGCMEVFACGDGGMAGWGRNRVHARMEHKGVAVK